MSETVSHSVRFEAAKTNMRYVVDWCQNNRVDFDSVLKSIRDEQHLIRMDRKDKTKDGQRVTILTVTAPETTYPVIGYCENKGSPMTWTSRGEHAKSVHTNYDLVLVED